MDHQFGNTIKGAIRIDLPLEEIVAILRDWRDQGVTASAAATTLEGLRDQCDDETEDRVLEILDIVAGNCRPGWRVWGQSK